MHQLLPLKLKVAIVVVLAGAFLFVAELLPSVRPLHLGLVVAIVEGVLVFLGMQSWWLFCKQPLRPGWAVDLSGKWNGSIVSQWKPNEGAVAQPAIPTEVEIVQDWLKFSVCLTTEKIISRSSGATVTFLGNSNELSVRYFYDTDPKAEFRQQNPPQTGCAWMTWSSSKPDQVSIRYTNDRGLGGDMLLARKKGRGRRKS